MSEPKPRWEIILTRQAEKTFYRLSKNLLQRLDQAIFALAANPHPPEAQQLPGHDNLYRLYVDDWRIAYAVEEERLIVLILEIAPKQKPERYQLEEEADKPPSTTYDKEWLENASASEDFYKILINQAVEDYIHHRTLGAKPYEEKIRLLGVIKGTSQEKIRVLIVDDIAETRENLRKLLYFESDIEIVGAATNGEEAIQMAVEQQPDVILMDIILPGINGITATEIISQQIPSAQIIMMSVQGDADTFRRAILAGAREFLIKPFSSDELMTSIRRVYQPAALQKLQATTPAASSIQDAFNDLKERIQAKLMAELDPIIDVSRPDEVRQAIQDMFERILTQENIILSRSERERLFEGIVAEMPGYADQATKTGQASLSHLYQAGMKLRQLTQVLVGEEAELDETQKRTLAQWFKFYKLGNNVEISLSVADLSESLSFYEKLGLGRVDGGEKPYPWAVVSDGRLHLGLHQQVFSSPTLGYFGLSILEERKVHLAKLGVKLDHIQMSWLNFVTAEFESPEGQRVLLADLRSDVETIPSGRKFFPKCQSFGELSLKTEDVNATVTYWERLGFERVAEGDQPYPWAIISDGRIRLGLHQTPKLTKPTITYFAPDMPDRLKRLRRRGIKFVTEHKDKKGRRVGAVIESPDGQLFFLFTGEIKSQTNGQNTEEPQANGSFKVGQKVRIVEGPFADFVGTVDEVDLDRTRVKVQITFFGQEKPVELDFSQVERV